MKTLLCIVLSAIFLFIFSFSRSRCEVPQDILFVSADGSKISVHVDNMPLGQVLSKLAERSALNIYITPSLSDVPVTASLENEPLEKAVQKLLKDFNYLARFKKVNGIERLASLKIYPKGTSSGNLISLGGAKKVIEVGSRQEPPGGGNLSQKNSGFLDNRTEPIAPGIPGASERTLQIPPGSGSITGTRESAEPKDQAYPYNPNTGEPLLSLDQLNENQDYDANGLKARR